MAQRVLQRLIGSKLGRWALMPAAVAGLLYAASALALWHAQAAHVMASLNAEPQPGSGAAYQPWEAAPPPPKANPLTVEPSRGLGEPPGPQQDESHARPVATVANAPLSPFPSAAVTPTPAEAVGAQGAMGGASDPDPISNTAGTPHPPASTSAPPTSTAQPPTGGDPTNTARPPATSTAQPPATTTASPLPPVIVLPTLALPTLPPLPIPTNTLLPTAIPPTNPPPPPATNTPAPIIAIPTLAPLPTLAIPTLPPLLP